MKYLKSDRTRTEDRSGHVSINRKPDEEVDETWVQNYVDAIDFFESIGGSETVRRTRGRIFATSVSPDGLTTREVIFTPIKEGPSL